MKPNHRIIVSLILFLSLIMHLVYASRLPVGNDEGAYLYDSWLVSLGRIPFVEFTTRSPLLLFVVSAGIRFFGNQLFYGRVVMSLSCVITAYVLYRIGSILYNNTVGLLACFFYAINPFLMTYGTTVFEEPLSMVFVSSSIYVMILSLNKKSDALILLSGILAGLSFLVRLSGAVALLVAWTTLILYGGRKLRNVLINFVGFMIPLIVFLSFMGFISGFMNLENVYPFSNILHIIQRESFDKSMFSIGVFNDKLTHLMASIPMILYIIPTSLVFLNSMMKKELNFSDKKSKEISIILFMTFILLFLYYLSLNDKFDNLGEVDTLWALIFMGVTTYYIFDMDVDEGKQKFSNVIILLWLLFFVLFYIWFYRFREHYLTEFIPQFSIMGAVVLGSIKLENKSIRTPLIFFVLIILLAFVFSFKFTYTRSPPILLGDTYRIADYINKNTEVGDEIFSATMVYPYLAGRKTIFDISHPQSIVDDKLSDNISEYIKSKKIKYIIFDRMMQITYFHCCSNVFEKLISEEYILDDGINNKITEHLEVKIYKRI